MKSIDWLKWTVATATAAATLGITCVVWAYSTFPTKDMFQMIIDRLDRIEIQLDRVLNK